jgi:hypothetical protein
MEKQEFLENSITNQKVVEFMYKDKLRVVHPTAIKGGSLVAWQVAGETSGRNLPCWANFSLSGIERLRETGETYRNVG